MSPTLRYRRTDRRNAVTHTKTQRMGIARDDEGQPLFNQAVQARGFTNRILFMFQRRVKGSKKSGIFSKADESSKVLVTSRLSIKRKMDARHIVTRQYKKAMRGVTGAQTWKDFDRMKVDKTGHLIIPASALRRQLVADSQREALGKTYKVHPQPLDRSGRRAKQRADAKAEKLRIKFANK